MSLPNQVFSRHNENLTPTQVVNVVEFVEHKATTFHRRYCDNCGRKFHAVATNDRYCTVCLYGDSRHTDDDTHLYASVVA